MGTLIEYRNAPNRRTASQLVVYCNSRSETNGTVYSLNKPLAAELVQLESSRRTMRLGDCFQNVLNRLPDWPIVMDIDVMFNPNYKVDVMKILISSYKHKRYSLIWPGNYAEGKLTYGEENSLDYHVYKISDYDVVCVF